jgi:hypothetical protein
VSFFACRTSRPDCQMLPPLQVRPFEENAYQARSRLVVSSVRLSVSVMVVPLLFTA